MKENTDLKEAVKQKYAEIVLDTRKTSCGCGCGSSDNKVSDKYTIFSDDYSKLQGYNPDADYNLGCGIPTEYALIKQGDTVLDLGSGAGNDCFVARSIVGDSGKVIGLDFTTAMVEKAQEKQ